MGLLSFQLSFSSLQRFLRTDISVFVFIVTVQRMLRDLQQMQNETGVVISKTSLSVELEKIASDKGFIISDNEGSGNCMFYALSEQLNLVKGIQISHVELRQRIVQYLKENPTLVSRCYYSV